MEEADARARLELMVAASSVPVLDASEVDDLVALARRSDASGTPPTIATWAASTRYIEGQVVIPTELNLNDHRYVVTEAGTTGASEPTWPTADGDTVTDGTVTWQEAGTDYWVPTWDLNTAAAEGWRRKAAKVAGNFDFGADGQNFDRSQVLDNCERMARMYDRGAAFTANRYSEAS